MRFASPGASVISRVTDAKYVVQFMFRNARESLDDGSLMRYQEKVSRVHSNGAVGRKILFFHDQRVLLPPAYGVPQPRGDRRRRDRRVHPDTPGISTDFRLDARGSLH